MGHGAQPVAGLVPTDLWDRVQQRLYQNRTVGQPERSREPTYPLAGLLWCAACQRPMSGRRSKSSARGGFHEYVCPMCTLSRSAARVEAAVHDVLR